MPVVTPAAAPGPWVRTPADPWARVTRWIVAGRGPRQAQTAVRLGGMHCGACAAAVEQAVRAVPGVVSAHVSAAAQCAVIRWDPCATQPGRFVSAIEQAGYSAVPDTAAGAREQRRSQERTALWQLFVAAFCAMQVMMLAAPAYLSDSGELAPDLKRLFDWGSWVLALPVLFFSAAPFFSGAWRALRERRIGMDVPVSLGIAVAFVASTAALFDPGGSLGGEVYFDSLTMFISFLLGSRYLEMRARHRAEAHLEASAEAWSRTALRVRPDGTVDTVDVADLRLGDVLRVPVGQAFPADGTLLSGSTQVDESMLSGEAVPVEKPAGAAIAAGTLNQGSPVEMRVDALGADTRYEQIMALVREAQTERNTQGLRLADRWAGPFLWTVLLMAVAAGTAWWMIEPARAIGVAVAVLIVTCPCALSLAGPSALMVAAGSLARRGLLLRRMDAIEGLARMDRLFIDKTGTLTAIPGGETLQMRRLGPPAGASDDALRAMAAALAGWSSHPLARSLAAQADAAAAPALRQIEELRSKGMQGVDGEGAIWRLGARDWAYGADAAADHGACDAAPSSLWLSRDGQVLASFDVDERLRSDAAACVRDLQADGVRITLVSGDLPARVAVIAGQSGIADFHGGLQPEQKLSMLSAAQQSGGVVAMVGDGINDAPVLAKADLSIAMGEGAWVARSSADGVLIGNGLAELVRARALAQRTLRVVKQNLVWAAAYNLACVPMALLGWLPPWAAGLGMAASSLAVVLNAARLSRP